ncbi:MAG: DJ-1/PfpI family protein [Firmicutes bacterium]|nr:DJ-1/PfpI family protein [Bacillota bacterium]
MLKTIVLVIAENQFRDEEYQIPKDAFERAGFKTITASTTTNIAIGKLGMEVKPDITVDKIDTNTIDALVYVGGGGSEQYFEDELAHRLAREMVDKDKVLAAICIAPVILANAGVLTGKTCTVFPDGAPTLKENGANYTGNLIETDGKIITGNGPEAAEGFANPIINCLNEQP